MRKVDKSRDTGGVPDSGIDSAPESHEGMSMEAIFEGFSDQIIEDALDAFWLKKPEHPELNGNGVTEEELLEKLKPNVKDYIRANLLRYDLLVRQHQNPKEAFQALIGTLVSNAEGRAGLIYSELVALKKAGIDALTGLPNVSVFKQNLKIGIRRNLRLGEKFSLVFFDLDHFKSINDTHGHQAGDMVLQEMARRLSQGGGQRTLDLAARYGGEEFVLLLPTTTKEGACIVAKRVSDLIGSRPFRVVNNEGESLEIEVSASMGVAQYTHAQDDPKGMEMLARADKCLYILKGKTPDEDGVVENRRGQIACDNRVITAEDIERYKQMFPSRPSNPPTP